METKSSEAQLALEKINTTFEEFTSFYGQLVEKGIMETEYGKVFSDMAQTFRGLYSTAKSNYDALLVNRHQFEEGRLERDAYERSLTRIEQYIIEAEFDIGVKILPYLKKVEKELLQDQIVKTAKAIDIPEEEKKEVIQDAENIKTSMTNAEKKGTVDQVKEYVGIGSKIVELGQKIWKFANEQATKAAPIVLPLILRVLGAP